MSELNVKLFAKVDNDLKEAVENLGKAMAELVAACEKSPVLVWTQDQPTQKGDPNDPR